MLCPPPRLPSSVSVSLPSRRTSGLLPRTAVGASAVTRGGGLVPRSAPHASFSSFFVLRVASVRGRHVAKGGIPATSSCGSPPHRRQRLRAVHDGSTTVWRPTICSADSELFRVVPFHACQHQHHATGTTHCDCSNRRVSASTPSLPTASEVERSSPSSRRRAPAPPPVFSTTDPSADA